MGASLEPLILLWPPYPLARITVVRHDISFCLYGYGHIRDTAYMETGGDFCELVSFDSPLSSPASSDPF